jgi:hypothetical protein
MMTGMQSRICARRVLASQVTTATVGDRGRSRDFASAPIWRPEQRASHPSSRRRWVASPSSFNGPPLEEPVDRRQGTAETVGGRNMGGVGDPFRGGIDRLQLRLGLLDPSGINPQRAFMKVALAMSGSRDFAANRRPPRRPAIGRLPRGHRDARTRAHFPRSADQIRICHPAQHPVRAAHNRASRMRRAWSSALIFRSIRAR